MEIVFGVLGWIVVGGFWVFVLWAIWTLLSTSRAMLQQLHRIADQLERLDAGGVEQTGVAD